jgi:tetratricopeptide (TPR) repeat protein
MHSPIWMRAIAALLAAALGLCGGATSARAQAQSTSAPAADPVTQAQRLLVRGMTRAYVGDTEAAITIYEKALQKAPREASILSALADAHAAEDDATSALFYARQARDAAPSNPAYHRQLARLQRSTGRLEEAIATYREITRRFPDDREARRHLAETLARADRPREAIDTYNRILQSAPAGEAEIRQEMLSLYRTLGDAGGVERTLQALIDLRPTDRSYRLELGRQYRESGRIQDAIEVYRDLLASHPSDPALVSDLAALYWRADRPERADSLLRRYTRPEAATPEQLVGRAQALYRGAAADAPSDPGLTETVTRLLETALDRAPSNATALQLLGQIRYEAGRYAEAGSLLTRALDQNPKAPKQWILAASAHLQADQPDLAAETAEEGLLLFPGQYPLVRTAAFAHLRTQNNRQALARMQEAVDLSADADTISSTRRADLFEGLGTLHRRLGDEAEARRAWEEALDLDPDRASLQERLRALPR